MHKRIDELVSDASQLRVGKFELFLFRRFRRVWIVGELQKPNRRIKVFAFFGQIGVGDFSDDIISQRRRFFLIFLVDFLEQRQNIPRNSFRQTLFD